MIYKDELKVHNNYTTDIFKLKIFTHWIWTAANRSSSASLNSFLSFNILPRLFIAWTYLGCNLYQQHTEKAYVEMKRTLTYLLSHNRHYSALLKVLKDSRVLPNWIWWNHDFFFLFFFFLPHCLPVVVDSSSLVASVSKAFANIIMHLCKKGESQRAHQANELTGVQNWTEYNWEKYFICFSQLFFF